MTYRTPTSEFALDAMLDNEHPVKLAAAAWARGISPTDMVRRDADTVFDRAAWQSCATAGLLGSTVPVADGGAGDDLVTSLLRLEGLGLGTRDNGFAYAVGSHLLSFTDAILRFATPAQRARILPRMCAGDLIGSFAITEAESGSDAFSMKTRALPDGDGWILNGEKLHITLAPIADLSLVFAMTEPDAGRWGVSAFLVWRDSPGVVFGDNEPKMGLRTTPYGRIHLDGYRVGADDLLGSVGSGASIFSACMESERSMIFATHLGAAERTIAATIDRARSRRQFGHPIGDFQAVSHRIADMKRAHEGARLLMYKAALQVAAGKQATLAGALAKVHAGEQILEIATSAARIHGALGYLTEYEIEREVRDAMGGPIYSGTSDVQKNTIAGLLGVG